MWLNIGEKILIVDEPTKGVDMGSRDEIYNILREMVKKGISIMMITSDLLECIGLSNRVLVIRNHKIVNEFNGAEINEARIIAAATELEII